MVEINRSEINPATYNPRKISEEGKKNLKKSIKKYGVVGGIVVNERTGNTIVGGHQKVKVLDELNKYPEKDYTLRVELIDVDEKTEKELNITLNNPNVGGEWDMDSLRELIPEIDYKNVGFTDADLNIIGVDFLLQTEEENSLASELNEMMQPVAQQKEEEREAKVAHMKEVKDTVKKQSQEKAENMEAYITLSFDTYRAKANFMKRFGYSEFEKFIKGEVFDTQIERIE